MENLWEKKSVGYGEEMERKWNGKFYDKSSGNKFWWNGMEIEWNWNGNIPVTKSIWLCIKNGNGVDKKNEEIFDMMDIPL